MVTVGDDVDELLLVLAVIGRPTTAWTFAVIKNAATLAATAALIVFRHPHAADDLLQWITRLVNDQDFDIAVTELFPHVLQSFD